MVMQFLLQTAQEEATLNVTLLKYFMPIFLFLFLFALVFALFKKTELLGDSPFPIMVISFIIAIVFVVTPAAVKFTNAITPWMVVFIISLLFIFLILSWLDLWKVGSGGFVGAVGGNTWLAWLIIVVILAIFIFAGISAFGPLLSPYDAAAGADGEVSDVIGAGVKNVLFHPAILGLALLFIIAAVTAWVIGTK